MGGSAVQMLAADSLRARDELNKDGDPPRRRAQVGRRGVTRHLSALRAAGATPRLLDARVTARAVAEIAGPCTARK